MHGVDYTGCRDDVNQFHDGIVDGNEIGKKIQISHDEYQEK